MEVFCCLWIGDWDWLCLAVSAGGDGCIKPEKRSEVNEKGKIRDKLLMSFLASGVVQLTTLPIVLWFYGEVSVMGIF